jgi:hypothetical protein
MIESIGAAGMSAIGRYRQQADAHRQQAAAARAAMEARGMLGSHYARVTEGDFRTALFALRVQATQEVADPALLGKLLAEIDAADVMFEEAERRPAQPVADIDAIEVDEENYEAVLAWAERRTASAGNHKIPAEPQTSPTRIAVWFAMAAFFAWAVSCAFSLPLPLGFLAGTVACMGVAVKRERPA